MAYEKDSRHLYLGRAGAQDYLGKYRPGIATP